MISDAVFALLNGNTDAADRVYPNWIPEGRGVAGSAAFQPTLIYQQVSGSYLHSNNGGSPTSVSRWQITAVAASYRAAAQLIDQVRRLADGYHGTLAAIVVQDVMAEPDSLRDIPYPDSQQEQLDRYGKSLDLRVMANEQAPNQ